MDSGAPIRKRGTSRLVVGVPQGQEQQISALIETSDGDVIVLREATLAALVQAYMDVFTHPTRSALELQAAAVPSSGAEPGTYQLVPGTTSEEELRRELAGSPKATFLDEDDDETQVQWNSMPAASGEPPHNPDGSASRLTTQAMASLEDSQSGARQGYQTRDDGPIFGNIPTQHSAPIRRKRVAEEPATDADDESSSESLD